MRTLLESSSHMVEHEGKHRPTYHVLKVFGSVRNVSRSGMTSAKAMNYLESLTWVTLYFQAIVMLGSNDYPRSFDEDSGVLAEKTFRYLLQIAAFTKRRVVGRVFIALPPPRPCNETWPTYHLYVKELHRLLKSHNFQSDDIVYAGFSPLLYDAAFKPRPGVLFKKESGQLDIHLSQTGYIFLNRWLSDVVTGGRSKPRSTQRRPKKAKV